MISFRSFPDSRATWPSPACLVRYLVQRCHTFRGRPSDPISRPRASRTACCQEEVDLTCVHTRTDALLEAALAATQSVDCAELCKRDGCEAASGLVQTCVHARSCTFSMFWFVAATPSGCADCCRQCPHEPRDRQTVTSSRSRISCCWARTAVTPTSSSSLRRFGWRSAMRTSRSRPGSVAVSEVSIGASGDGLCVAGMAGTELGVTCVAVVGRCLGLSHWGVGMLQRWHRPQPHQLLQKDAHAHLPKPVVLSPLSYHRSSRTGDNSVHCELHHLPRSSNNLARIRTVAALPK